MRLLFVSALILCIFAQILADRPATRGASRSGSTGSGWRPPSQANVPVGQQQHQQFSEFDDYDQTGQQVQENDWDDLNQLQQKPAKGQVTVKPTTKPGVPSHLEAAASCTTPVKTAYGLVRGKVVKSAAGKDVCAFLGIPYAKPPVGDLRFKRPVAKGSWEGTLETTTLPNSCYQVDYSGGSIWSPNTKLSEDCLYLNIWVPLSIFKTKGLPTATPTAVMIWIHGGGWTSGTSTLELYDGATLAGDNDVIVASMQYRLGQLGFLSFGCDEAPGNLGLLDQVLALQWLKDNVAQFGGNPNELTVFGESAGSFSTAYLLLSPLSKHLVKRGIMMSGSPSKDGILYRTNSEAKEVAYELAESVGCWTRSETKSVPDILDCLRKQSAEKITKANFKARRFVDMSAAATIDGYFLMDTPENLISRQENGRADLIIGNVQNEGSFFLLTDFPQYFSFDASKIPQINYNSFQTIVRQMFRNRPEFEQEAILTRYTNWKNVDDSAANVERLVEMAGDSTIVCPDVDFANRWSSQGHRVFFYSFNQRSSNSLMGKWVGVKHADDCEYTFGGPIKEASRPKGEKDLSKKLQQLLSNFAKTGVPSANWGQYTPAYPIYLDLNATIISDQTPRNVFGPRADACAFWNVELPRLRECNAAAGRSLKPLQSSNVPKSCSTVTFQSKDNEGRECSAATGHHHTHPSSGGVHGGNQPPVLIPHGRAAVVQDPTHHEPDCVPGTTKKMNCNTCTCSEKGVYTCTKMACVKFGENVHAN